MMRWFSQWIPMIVALLAALCAGPARAQEALPAGGEPVFEDALAALGEFENARGSAQIVSVDGPGFARAIRVTSKERGESWDLQVNAALPKGVEKGEVMLLTFWARTIRTVDESEQGIFRAAAGLSRAPWTKSLQRTMTVGGDWTQFVLPFRSRDSYDPGGMNMALEVGSTVQAIEFGDVRLLSYGDRVSLDALPRTRVTYPGRAPDAAWRAEAEQRIRANRMAPFTVRVVDAGGAPVEGARVHVRMTRQAFQFGCAFRAWYVVDQEEPASRFYQEKIPELFNAGSFVNSLKWPPWSGDWGEQHSREASLKALQWVKDHGLTFRGHVLVWPSWQHLPQYMREYRENPNPEAIRKEVLDHIDSITTATRGYVSEWDVINEPFHNHALMDICGRDVMVDWFKRARRNLPDAGLSLNDFGILTALTDSPHQQNYEETIQYLLDNGAPLTVLGLQGHFGGTAPGPARIYATLERYARFGLPMRVTEFTMGTDDEQLQADFLRDCMTVLYSHPSVIGFQFWGPGQLFTRDFQEKPNLRAYRELVFNKWWTDETGRTDGAGDFSGRGFLGRCEATVTLGDRRATHEFELAKPTAYTTVIVELPGE